jgi:carbamoyl-phosphate synthase small subunit
MAGYQEILSDLSYTDQAVVMTYPLIGNYGMAAEDYESITPSIGAIIVREYNDEPSNFRSVNTLGDVMKAYGIPGISGVDTRALTRSIRDYGTRKALITGADVPRAEGLEILRSTTLSTNAVSRVSCRDPWTSESLLTALNPLDSISSSAGRPLRIVAVDCGMKRNIVRSLNRRGCSVTVLPWNTPADRIRALRPDGILLSNGPGDPTDVPETIAAVRSLIGSFPIFGICLGHQILSLAYGARTYKLKFGHRGGNHPVKNLLTGKIEITSQNHSYAIEEKSLTDTPLEVTHLNLLDGTIEGVECARDRAFGVQYHPESAPGPQDSAYLFDRFIDLMKSCKKEAPHA